MDPFKGEREDQGPLEQNRFRGSPPCGRPLPDQCQYGKADDGKKKKSDVECRQPKARDSAVKGKLVKVVGDQMLHKATVSPVHPEPKAKNADRGADQHRAKSAKRRDD